jgi:response regulator of citrate/malate metabolism
MKKVIQIFKSHEEQETAEINYWKRISRGKRVESLEKIRLNYLRMKYGRVPRLRRVYKLIKQE